MRKINEIILHTSATRPDWMQGKTTWAKRQEIKRWHVQDRGWSDIGYHYLIDRDGTVVNGRPVIRAGAHVRGHNAHSIGICLLGGRGGTKDDKFYDHYTEAQMKSLKELIAKLRKDFPEIEKNITGHNQYANKGCPCFYVPHYLTKLIGQTEQPVQEKEEPKKVYRIRRNTSFLERLLKWLRKK